MNIYKYTNDKCDSDTYSFRIFISVYGYSSALSKFTLGHFAFIKTYTITCIPYLKKFQEDCGLYEKRQKVKTAFIICFAVSCYRGGLFWCYKLCAPQVVRVAPLRPFPRNYTQHLSQTAIALNCVCEYLCFTSILFPIST